MVYLIQIKFQTKYILFNVRSEKGSQLTVQYKIFYIYRLTINFMLNIIHHKKFRSL